MTARIDRERDEREKCGAIFKSFLKTLIVLSRMFGLYILLPANYILYKPVYATSIENIIQNFYMYLRYILEIL